MTAELAFAKTFLSSLDAKPSKLSADYVADPDTLELKGPYTLPRMPHAMKAPDQPEEVAGSAPGIDILLKSLKNPPIHLMLTGQPLTTSVLDLKQKVAAEVGLESIDKVRLLHNKKPCSDSKSIKDVLAGSTETTVEFSVMVMGGVPAKTAAAANITDTGLSEEDRARQILQGEAFWTDLEGFLEQRLKSSQVAQDAAKTFRQAWSKTT